MIVLQLVSFSKIIINLLLLQFPFCGEYVADHTIQSYTLSMNDGSICDPLFVCTESLVSFVHGIRSDS